MSQNHVEPDMSGDSYQCEREELAGMQVQRARDGWSALKICRHLEPMQLQAADCISAFWLFELSAKPRTRPAQATLSANHSDACPALSFSYSHSHSRAPAFHSNPIQPSIPTSSHSLPSSSPALPLTSSRKTPTTTSTTSFSIHIAAIDPALDSPIVQSAFSGLLLYQHRNQTVMSSVTDPR